MFNTTKRYVHMRIPIPILFIVAHPFSEISQCDPHIIDLVVVYLYRYYTDVPFNTGHNSCRDVSLPSPVNAFI